MGRNPILHRLYKYEYAQMLKAVIIKYIQEQIGKSCQMSNLAKRSTHVCYGVLDNVSVNIRVKKDINSVKQIMIFSELCMN